MLELELVVDCMRAGLKKKSGGSRGGAAPPPAGGGWGGGAGAPPICKRTRFPAKKKLWKENVEY